MRSCIYMLTSLPIWMLSYLTCKTPDGLSENPGRPIQAEFIEHQPYCGGAKPNDEQLKGSRILMANHAFIVKHGNENHDSLAIIQTLETDQNGIAILNLSPGTYQIHFLDKGFTFNEFYALKHKSLVNFRHKQISCYKTWWRTPEAKLNVHDSITAATRSPCGNIRPESPNEVVFSTDGGVYYSTIAGKVGVTLSQLCSSG